MTPIIEIKNLSKKYTLKESQKYYTLRDSLNHLFTRPFSRSSFSKSKDEFYALKNISLNIEPGEIIGLVGKNGAGKSTLLKVLSQITPPTTGKAILRGRIGSLLEVGTGFHQELSGLENIYLNGAILGMSRREIKRKLEEIIDFAEISQFINTPVKHYSSGMYVRLAFAVAAHLEPEILLVDEVLAVGDAAFQKKSLGKMEDISKKKGKTIIFVSHNLNAINTLCQKAIWIDSGQIRQFGKADSVTEAYLKSVAVSPAKRKFSPKNSLAYINEISILDHECRPKSILYTDKPWQIEVIYTLTEALSGVSLDMALFTAVGSLLFTVADTDSKTGSLGTRKPGRYSAVFSAPSGLLNTGGYSIKVSVGVPIQYKEPYDSKVIEGMQLIQNPTFNKKAIVLEERRGPILVKGNWKTRKFASVT